MISPTSRPSRAANAFALCRAWPRAVTGVPSPRSRRPPRPGHGKATRCRRPGPGRCPATADCAEDHATAAEITWASYTSDRRQARNEVATPRYDM